MPVVYPTYVPTATWSPPTATTVPCNWARYVSDVTVPDGTIFAPGQSFTKTWRLLNIGSCAWRPGYSLVFQSGDRMHTQSTVPLNITVHPGQAANISVNLTAPSTPGQYRSYWMLSNTTGQLFGIGAAANSPFWVDIKVVAPQAYAFNFVQQMCNAAWRSNTTLLPCPGSPNSADGSIVRLDQPALENGRQENEPALWMRPAQSQDGWIMGVFPPFKIEAGDHFQSDIGCLADSLQCDVTFYLSYAVSGQPETDLGAWRQVYDGNLKRIDIDLSPLAGKTVQFVLRVVNNGKAADANAFWLVPAIRR